MPEICQKNLLFLAMSSSVEHFNKLSPGVVAERIAGWSESSCCSISVDASQYGNTGCNQEEKLLRSDCQMAVGLTAKGRMQGVKTASHECSLQFVKMKQFEMKKPKKPEVTADNDK